jgi:hypothetical protein
VRGVLGELHNRIAVARRVDEGYVMRGADGGGMAVSDFVGFMGSYGADLDLVTSIVDDALAVAEDGCVKCLARLHDGLAEQMYEWALAAAFAEKLARRFDKAAA